MGHIETLLSTDSAEKYKDPLEKHFGYFIEQINEICDSQQQSIMPVGYFMPGKYAFKYYGLEALRISNFNQEIPFDENLVEEVLRHKDFEDWARENQLIDDWNEFETFMTKSLQQKCFKLEDEKQLVSRCLNILEKVCFHYEYTLAGEIAESGKEKFFEDYKDKLELKQYDNKVFNLGVLLESLLILVYRNLCAFPIFSFGQVKSVLLLSTGEREENFRKTSHGEVSN